jgi:hypothetical protein
VEEYEGDMFVDGGQIFGEPVQNVSDEVGVEKSHSSVDYVVHHVLVQLDGGSPGCDEQRHDPTKFKKYCQYHHSAVKVLNKIASVYNFVLLVLSDVRTVVKTEVRNLLFVVDP